MPVLKIEPCDSLSFCLATELLTICHPFPLLHWLNMKLQNFNFYNQLALWNSVKWFAILFALLHWLAISAFPPCTPLVRIHQLVYLFYVGKLGFLSMIESYPTPSSTETAVHSTSNDCSNRSELTPIISRVNGFRASKNLAHTVEQTSGTKY